jgi:ribosomal protein S18 acetylase RimI-like enzyme
MSDLPEVAATFADAFYNDPVARWWLRDDGRYGEALVRFHTIMATDDIPKGHTFLSGDGRAAAQWQPPERERKPMSLWEQLTLLPSMLQATGFAKLPRLLRLISFLDAHHPKAEHFYLFFLGVRDEAQGKGLGSAILKASLARVDAAGMPAYLENSNPANTRFYERHGFKVQAQAAPAPGGPMMQFMWREAQG